MFRFKLLGVLLCYNDADILEDAILHLLEHNHDLVVWDHGSDDGTAEGGTGGTQEGAHEAPTRRGRGGSLLRAGLCRHDD